MKEFGSVAGSPGSPLSQSFSGIRLVLGVLQMRSSSRVPEVSQQLSRRWTYAAEERVQSWGSLISENLGPSIGMEERRRQTSLLT